LTINTLGHMTKVGMEEWSFPRIVSLLLRAPRTMSVPSHMSSGIRYEAISPLRFPPSLNNMLAGVTIWGV
jgi:hypothetical protein